MDPISPASDQEGTAPAENTPVETNTEAVGTETQSESALSDFWNPVMEIVPSQLHSQVIPKFREWDANFTRKMQEVHSQYEPYKPYLENKVEPERIDYALQIMDTIENNPQQVFEALQSFMQENGLMPATETTPTPNAPEVTGEEYGEQGQPQNLDEAVFKHPAFLELQNAVQIMAQQFIEQNQQAAISQQAQEFDREVHSLEEKYGAFDQEWVLTKALTALNAGEKVNGLEPFVQEYKQFETDLISRTRAAAAPPVLGGAGQADLSQGFDPKNLTDAQRRDIVRQRLSAAAQQT